MKDQDLQLMFDCLGRLMTITERDLETAQVLRAKLQDQLNQYDSKHQRFRDELEASNRLAINSAVDKNVVRITSAFEEAKEAAYLAAQRYEKSSKWSIWKVVLTGVLVFGLLLGSSISAFFLFFSPEEIKRRVGEVIRLEAQIDKLEANGALAKITRCSIDEKLRLCVRACLVFNLIAVIHKIGKCEEVTPVI